MWAWAVNPERRGPMEARGHEGRAVLYAVRFRLLHPGAIVSKQLHVLPVICRPAELNSNVTLLTPSGSWPILRVAAAPLRGRVKDLICSLDIHITCTQPGVHDHL